MHNLSVTADNRTYTFAQVCGVYCLINDPIWTFQVIKIAKFQNFQKALTLRRRAEAAGESLDNRVRLDYPFMAYYGLKINMAPHFYGVRSNASASAAATSIDHVHIMVLWYPSSERKNDTMETVLQSWELAMDAYLRAHFGAEGRLKALPHGNYSISNEVLRAGILVVPYYSVGFAIMLAFIAVTVSAGAVYHGVLSFACVAITLAAVLTPCLAAAATFGVFTWANLHTNVMMLMAPFLILAIGVDDAFLLIHAWQRVCLQRASVSRCAKLGVVLADVGPSILITSITNTVAFSIGAIASPPEISLFCGTVAAAMAVAFVYQLTLFTPIMMLTAKDEVVLKPALRKEPSLSAHGTLNRQEQPDGGAGDALPDSPTKRQQMAAAELNTGQASQSPHRVTSEPLPHQAGSTLHQHAWSPCKTGMQQGLVAYAKFVTSHAGRTLAAIVLAGYLAASITGVMRMKSELFPEDVMPVHSPLIEMMKIRHEYMWKEYHPIGVLINRRLNYSDARDVLAMNVGS